MESFIEQHNLLCPSQYGFRKTWNHGYCEHHTDKHRQTWTNAYSRVEFLLT